MDNNDIKYVEAFPASLRRLWLNHKIVSTDKGTRPFSDNMFWDFKYRVHEMFMCQSYPLCIFIESDTND